MQPKAIARPALKPAPDRRQRLLEAATALFARRGYSTVTIKAIAAATKANPALIYYYFGSKEGLFRAVVESLTEQAQQTFEAVCSRARSPEDVIRAWIGNQAAQLPLMRRLFTIGIDYANAHKRSVPVDRAIRRLYEIEADILGAAMRDGIGEGDFAAIDVDGMISFISTFLDGALAHAAIAPSFDARAEILRFSDRVLLELRRDDARTAPRTAPRNAPRTAARTAPTTARPQGRIALAKGPPAA